MTRLPFREWSGRLTRALTRDLSGVVMVEFATTLPFLVLTFLGGTELAHYTVTKMRVSQLALQIADNGSRMGTTSLTSGNQQVDENDIKDILTGAGVEASGLDLYNRGRVIISSVEPDPNNAGKNRIHWQRCRGVKNVTSSYGVEGAANLTGVGPTGQKVTAITGSSTTTDSAAIFVEVVYDYQPLFSASLVPRITMDEIGSMMVRENRDYSGPNGSTTGLYNANGITAATCNLFTAT